MHHLFRKPSKPNPISPLPYHPVFSPALNVAQPFRGLSRQGSTPPAWYLPLIWFKMSGSIRCHCPRRPAPAAMRRNMASLMVRMVRSAKWPLAPLLNIPEIDQLLELPLELGAVAEYTLAGTPTFFMPAAVVVAKRSFSGSAATFLVSASITA